MRRGFTLIGLIVVIVIILLLTLVGLQLSDKCFLLPLSEEQAELRAEELQHQAAVRASEQTGKTSLLAAELSAKSTETILADTRIITKVFVLKDIDLTINDWQTGQSVLVKIVTDNSDWFFLYTITTFGDWINTPRSTPVTNRKLIELARNSQGGGHYHISYKEKIQPPTDHVPDYLLTLDWERLDEDQ